MSKPCGWCDGTGVNDEPPRSYGRVDHAHTFRVVRCYCDRHEVGRACPVRNESEELARLDGVDKRALREAAERMAATFSLEGVSAVEVDEQTGEWTVWTVARFDGGKKVWETGWIEPAREQRAPTYIPYPGRL